jgi:4a-hydroxytetrahydrobiopterin dehydratase
MKDTKCASCELDAEKITQEEQDYMMSVLTDWTIITDEAMKKVQRVYSFKDFKQAISFSNKVGDLAEKHNHHPAILTEWGKVTVTWWSHGIGALTLKDLDMAGGCDNLFV